MDESWAAAPGGDALQEELGTMGLYDEGLMEEWLQARWVKFNGLDLGIMLAKC